MTRISKRTLLRAHSMQRAAQRYGVTLNGETRARIIAEIRGGRSRMVKRQSNRVTIHDLELDGKRLRVVYDRHRAELVTFLPLEGRG